MGLHELYFASLGGDGTLKAAGKPAGFGVGLKRDFGTFERWRDEFVVGRGLCSLFAQRNMTHALIIGGDIGGLTAALQLHQVGIEVTVFEAVPEVKPLGVGISLLPHVTKVLHQ